MSEEQRSERDVRLQRAAELSERIAERCESLMQGLERANELQRELDAQARAITDSVERLRAEVAEAAAAPGPVPAERGGNLDTVRLIALQMKHAGRSRSQVHDHLRGRLGIEDPDAVLAEVFPAR